MTRSSAQGWTKATLIALLSPTLGLGKATEVVSAAIGTGRSPGTELSRDEALDVLEKIAMTPGLVGVCARFAKTRVHLGGN